MLPRHNLAHLAENEHLLSERQWSRLTAVQKRMLTMPARFDRSEDNYAATAGIVLMSDWNHADRFCRCCIRNDKCKVWKFCPHCAYVRAKENVNRFGPLFPKGQWHFVTLSFEGNLRFEVPFDEQPLPYWNAIRKALRQWVAEHHIDGAFWVEELYLRALRPVPLVLPHCHAIVHADEISDAATDECRAIVSQFQGDAWDWNTNTDESDPHEVVELPLSLDVQPIRDENDFVNKVRYMTKPIDLVCPYLRGVDRLSNDGEFAELNQSVDDFLNAHDLHCLKRQQLTCIGSLDVKRRRLYLGNQ